MVDLDPAVQRVEAAKLLVHGLTGDSWGIQDALIESGANLTEGWPIAWHIGQLLRELLDVSRRADLVDQLRRLILSSQEGT